MKLAAIIVMSAVVAFGQTNLISPIMTSASTPSPYVVSASDGYYSYQAWTMFANSGDYYWFLHDDNMGTTMVGNWWMIYMGSDAPPVALYQFSKYGLISSPYPSAWRIEGSNNGSDWTTIDSRTDILISDSVLTSQFFSVALSNVAPYAYIKFIVDEVSSSPYKNNCGMDDFKFWEIIIPSVPPPYCAKFASDSGSGTSIISGDESGITVLK